MVSPRDLPGAAGAGRRSEEVNFFEKPVNGKGVSQVEWGGTGGTGGGMPYFCSWYLSWRTMAAAVCSG